MSYWLSFNSTKVSVGDGSNNSKSDRNASKEFFNSHAELHQLTTEAPRYLQDDLSLLISKIALRGQVARRQRPLVSGPSERRFRSGLMESSF